MSTANTRTPLWLSPTATLFTTHLTSVDARYCGARHAHARKVADQRRKTLLLDVIRDDDALVLHELRYVRRLAARRSGHVEDALSRLWVKRHDRDERRRGLEHVVPREVLGCRAERNRGLVDLEANLRRWARMGGRARGGGE